MLLPVASRSSSYKRRLQRGRLLLAASVFSSLCLLAWTCIDAQTLEVWSRALPKQFIKGKTGEERPSSAALAVAVTSTSTTSAEHQVHSQQTIPLFKIPPIYEKYYEQERRLPQHNASLPYPEGKNGRFLLVSNQVWGLGWNNAFQTYYMLALMAYLSNRAFVFRPYTWDMGEDSFVEYYGKTLPSRIPLTVILSGPMAGAPFPPPSTVVGESIPPRAVNEEYFHSVCPRERVKVLSVEEISEGTNTSSASVVMDRYVRALRDDTEDGCVELRGQDHPFDWRIFGTTRILSIWPTLSASPIMTHFAWSPLILYAVQSNLHLLAPSSVPSLNHSPPLDLSLPTPLPTLLAVHIRRGDYASHCHLLANWSSTYMGWAQHPALPLSDAFVPPPGGSDGDNTPENRAIYMQHCWPTVEQVVKRVGDVRREWEATSPWSDSDHDPHSGTRTQRKLTNLHIMTNAEPTFLSSLLTSLRSSSSLAGTWDRVTSGSELELSAEQSYVEQAIDMAIGERAGVFIGNGFSSLTANVIMLRMARGQPMESNRFW